MSIKYFLNINLLTLFSFPILCNILFIHVNLGPLHIWIFGYSRRAAWWNDGMQLQSCKICSYAASNRQFDISYRKRSECRYWKKCCALVIIHLLSVPKKAYYHKWNLLYLGTTWYCCYADHAIQKYIIYRERKFSLFITPTICGTKPAFSFICCREYGRCNSYLKYWSRRNIQLRYAHDGFV